MACSVGKEVHGGVRQFGSGLIRLQTRESGSQRSPISDLIFQATALSPEQLAEAKDAISKLNGTSLSEAVRFYLLHAKPVGGTKPCLRR